MCRLILATFVLLATTGASNAQRSTYQQMMDFNRIINNRINNDLMMKNMCAEWRRKGQTIPAECNKYSTSGSSSGDGTSSGRGIVKGNLKFTPIAGDTSMQQYADSNGSTAEERQFLLHIANAAKILFEERYSSKGWANNVAGSLAFFIISNMSVYTGTDAGEASQQALFEALDATLSQSPEFASTANNDRQALYNTLIAYSGFPMILYAEGTQKGNRDQVQKARTIAAGYIRTFLKTEPDNLRSLVR